MSATAPDTWRRLARSSCWPLLVVALVCASCAEAPLPKQAIRRDDCLRELKLANLSERLQACHAVVAAFPKDPAPLNDRYLLHSLAGDMEAACRDNRQAVALARRLPPKQLDRLLRNDLELREQSCRPAVIGR